MNPRNLLFAIFALIFLILACTEEITPPDSVRFDLSVILMDTSGFSETLYGTEFVDSARVFLISGTYHYTLDTISGDSGKAVFTRILPDRYGISATRRIPAEIAEQYTGSPGERILNGQISDMELKEGSPPPILYLNPAAIGKIVFSEIYYNGAPPNPPYYFHDQFTEIYNNSDSTVFLDSLIIADVAYGYAEDSLIHSIHAYMFPGSGKEHPLNPGECIVIAQDAIDHSSINPNSIDLSQADFEYYSPQTGDGNNPEVEDMVQIHHKYGVDFLYSVMNDAIVLIRVRNPYEYGYDEFDQILFPKSAVLDGVEYRDNLSETDLKRLDPGIDAGLTGGFEMYMRKSVARKPDYVRDGRIILMDNNNSSIDFRILDNPSPGIIENQR